MGVIYFFLRHMDITTFEIEKEFARQGYDCIIGTDEVGRGPLAGPVVAAAALFKGIDFNFPEQFRPEFALIRDSKKLSEKQREKAFDFIHEWFHIGIGLCDHETIDRINILEASFLAMKKAVQELLRNVSHERFQASSSDSNKQAGQADGMRNTRCMILVDGNKTIPNFSFEQRAIIGGDRLVKSIAAASIIAKVTRDRMMDAFAEKYPSYGFEQHSGYGTKTHLDALTLHGPCAIHRKSFGPVKRLKGMR